MNYLRVVISVLFALFSILLHFSSGLNLSPLLWVVLAVLVFPKKVEWKIGRWSRTANTMAYISACVILFIFSMCETISIEKKRQSRREMANVLFDKSLFLLSKGDINSAHNLAIEAIKLSPNSYNDSIGHVANDFIKFGDEKSISKIISEMDDNDFVLLEKGKLDTLFLVNQSLNNAFLKKVSKMRSKRERIITKKNIEFHKERSDDIERQFSALDGSHINLMQYVKGMYQKKGANVSHDETSLYDYDIYILVVSTYNVSKDTQNLKGIIKAKYTPEGDMIEVIEHRNI